MRLRRIIWKRSPTRAERELAQEVALWRTICERGNEWIFPISDDPFCYAPIPDGYTQIKWRFLRDSVERDTLA